ncbi:MAG: hypothetical protein QNJ65_20955 [Xenococcaceae cyanobacterium MO_234.B1]|nr:hypothetical protein [Xenococcaceae cyanobacterium MO_234.B1]
MNFRTVIFSGIMTALIGAMLGLAVNHISERPSRRPMSLIVGASLGFVIGAAYQAVEQGKSRIMDDNDIEPSEQNQVSGEPYKK